VVLAAQPALKWSAYLFFYGYVFALIAAGTFGVLFAPIDARYLLGLDVTHLPPLTAATTMSQYRFLRAIEIGLGVLAVVLRKEIYRERLFNRLFLAIMAGGIAARLIGLLFDGRPAWAQLFFLVYELIGIVLIFLYTRTTVRPR
jgi:hypothetical protein